MKTEKEIHQHRKDEHLSLAYKYWREEKNQTSGLTFSDSRIIPNSLPELSTKKINFSSEVFGQNFEDVYKRQKQNKVRLYFFKCFKSFFTIKSCKDFKTFFS